VRDCAEGTLFIAVTLDAGNGKVSENYRFLYQVINRANSIIEQLDNKGKEAFGTDTKTPGYIRSEALFLRCDPQMLVPQCARARNPCAKLDFSWVLRALSL